jgi:hypothetical protein
MTGDKLTKITVNMPSPYIQQVFSAGPDKGTFCTLYSYVLPPSSSFSPPSFYLPLSFLPLTVVSKNMSKAIG